MDGTINSVDVRISDAVAELLPADQVRLLRQGDSGVAPEYECWECHRPGDMRTDATSIVVFGSPGDAARTIGFVHATCGPSEAFPLSELQARQGTSPAPGVDYPGGELDVVYSSVVEAAGTMVPQLTLVLSNSLSAIRPDFGAPRDACVEEAVKVYGFERISEYPCPMPAPVPEWAVRIKNRALIDVARPGGTWWNWPQNSDPYTMDPDWFRFAMGARQVLLLVTGARVDADSEDDLRVELAAVAANGRLAGAVVSLRPAR
jgi:hypothetical protein